MLITIINLLLSPFCLLLFLLLNFSPDSKHLVPAKTNVYRLKLISYIIFSLLYVSVILIASYVFIEFTNSTLHLWEIFIPRYYWVSGFAWLVTLFTVVTYVKGMEGNIMGFIFFPLIIISVVSLIAVNVKSVFSSRWYAAMPTLELNFWVKFVLHAFSPIYLLTLFNQPDTDSKKSESWIAVIVASLIMQLALFGIHWLVLYFFDISMSFYSFFGANEPLLYFLPMFFGILYFIVLHLAETDRLKNIKKVIPYLTFVIYLMALVQGGNYFMFIQNYY